MRNECRILVCKPEGKEPFPSLCWGDNIKMHLEDIGIQGCGLLIVGLVAVLKIL
jgi:hypothetical protein